MAAAVCFAGDSGFLRSVHQIEKRDHGRVEEEKASSPRGLARAEDNQGARVAVSEDARLGEISKA
jgi:hypothetical protein